MSSPGANGNGFSSIQKRRTELHVPLRRLAAHSSQGHGTVTELVLSSEEDVEKGPLDNYGLQPKHVGVTWEDLQVMVHGDEDRKVKSFSWELDRSSYFSIRHTSRHLTVGSFVCSWTT